MILFLIKCLIEPKFDLIFFLTIHNLLGNPWIVYYPHLYDMVQFRFNFLVFLQKTSYQLDVDPYIPISFFSPNHYADIVRL